MFYTNYHGCHGNISPLPNVCEKWKFFKSSQYFQIIFKARIKKISGMLNTCFTHICINMEVKKSRGKSEITDRNVYA